MSDTDDAGSTTADDNTNDIGSIVGNANGKFNEVGEVEIEGAVVGRTDVDFDVFVISNKGIRVRFACRPV